MDCDSCSCLFNTFIFRDPESVLSVTNASISTRKKLQMIETTNQQMYLNKPSCLCDKLFLPHPHVTLHFIKLELWCQNKNIDISYFMYL